MLTVIVQIDIKDENEVPDPKNSYQDQLSFRLSYDSKVIEAHKFQVRRNHEEAKLKDTTVINFTKISYTALNLRGGVLQLTLPKIKVAKAVQVHTILEIEIPIKQF